MNSNDLIPVEISAKSLLMDKTLGTIYSKLSLVFFTCRKMFHTSSLFLLNAFSTRGWPKLAHSFFERDLQFFPSSFSWHSNCGIFSQLGHCHISSKRVSKNMSLHWKAQIIISRWIQEHFVNSRPSYNYTWYNSVIYSERLGDYWRRAINK